MNLPRSSLAFTFFFVRQQWLKFSLIGLTSVLWAVNDAFFPYFLKRLINAIQTLTGPREAIYHEVAITFILLVSFWGITELLMRVQGWLMLDACPKLRASIRESVFDYVKAHSISYFANHFAGNIAKKLSDLPSSCQSLIEIVLFQFVTSLVGALIVAIMMWHINPLFSYLLISWIAVHMLIASVLMNRGNQLWAEHSQSVSVLNGKIVDIFSNMLSVNLFAHSNFEQEYLQGFQQQEIKKSRRAMIFVELTRLGLGLSGLLYICGMISLLLYGWVHHWVTVGDFTQIGMQSFWLMGWVWFASYQMMVFAREMGTVDNALTLIRKQHDIVDVPEALSIVITHGDIHFEKVVFSYRKNQFLFRDLTVTIPAGQKVGLVGYSGSGKTSFVNVLMRFFDIQSGQIFIDKQNIAEVTQESLRAQIAMIPQDPSLFHRTLMENIRYGRLTATDEEVIAAAKLAHCDEFIQHLPKNYLAMVGERGVKLSGGQRQRIAIARAILKNAPILILDEATSALDSVTEKLIQESLQFLMQGKTTLIVAHRLSTLINMDRILVFDKGRIVEQGTQAELLEINGHFANLWNMQSDGLLPDSSTN